MRKGGVLAKIKLQVHDAVAACRIAQCHRGILRLRRMIESHSLPSIRFMARGDALGHFVAVINDNRLMDNMITRIVCFIVNRLAFGDNLARRQSIGITFRDGFKPFFSFGNHCYSDWANDVIAAGIMRQKTQPIAIITCLHGHRWRDGCVIAILSRRHLPLCKTLTLILVVPSHIHLGQVKHLVLTHLQCGKLPMSHRRIFDMEGNNIAVVFIAAIDDGETDIISAIIPVS